MIGVALLTVVAGLTILQWASLVGALSSIVRMLVVVNPKLASTFEQVVTDVKDRMNNDLTDHRTAANKMITEGYAVHGWDDEETKRWLDNATPTGNG